MFKSKTDSKPQHVRLKPSNSLLFLSLLRSTKLLSFFSGFQMFSKEDHKRVPVFFVRQMFQQKTHKKKKTKPTKAILKLKLNDFTSVAPQLSRSEAASQTTSSCFPVEKFSTGHFSPKQKSFQTEKFRVFSEKTF